MSIMKEQYIVLRTDPAQLSAYLATKSGFRSRPGKRQSPLRIEFSVDELDTKQVVELDKDPSVTAAPNMPVVLVAPWKVMPLSSDIDAPPILPWALQAINATNSPFSGAGINVGLLDTGIDSAHPAFTGIQLEERDFTGEGAGDQNGHGTHCAGTFFGRTTAGTRIGVAPGIERAFIAKVLDSLGRGTVAGIMKGIAWCVERGASIISMSLSINFAGQVEHLQTIGYPLEMATSQALRGYFQTVILFERYASLLEAETVIGAGTLLVAAAGNESRCDENPEYRLWASPPASAPSVISVAAVDRPVPGMVEYPLASFSNWGTALAAPGVGIVSSALGGGLSQMDGTSMAAPHVAGVAALWAQKLLLLSGSVRIDQLRLRLLGSGRPDHLMANVRHELGAGLVDAPVR
jgi:subtilisin family serine protease